MMTIKEPVWSIWNCSKCKPLKKRSFEDSKKAGEQLNMNMNPRTCPYKYIEFLDTGIIRRRIAYGDEQILGIKNWPPEEIIHCDGCGCDAPGLGLTCSECSVSLGEVHHITCDMETCPRCKEQLLLCNCFNLGSGNRDKAQLIRQGEPIDYIIWDGSWMDKSAIQGHEHAALKGLYNIVNEGNHKIVYKHVTFYKKLPRNVKEVTGDQEKEIEQEILAGHIGR
jgi:hypothetical protein